MLDPQKIGAPIARELLVVMPVYNEEANIGTVLDEWTDQLAGHASGLAFVIINDGSKDNTQAILEDYGRAQPEWFAVVRKPNSGHGNSCRVGYDVASGPPDRLQGAWLLERPSMTPPIPQDAGCQHPK
jgi:glycosyltransferase involved in cell wall biosynthesis